MALVLDANVKVMKVFHKKMEKILKQTGKYLKENQLTPNADKTEMLFFTNHSDLDSESTFNEKVIKPAHVFALSGSTN